MTIKHLFFAPLLLLAVFTACGNGTGQQAGVVSTVNTDEFAQLLEKDGAQLIDVRTPEEFAEGHLPNAKNMDVNDPDFTTHFAELDKNKPVLVYCRSGVRSLRAAGDLEDAGFTRIYNLDGGILKWEASGKPLEK
jgi:rhodanese-related sulfurtransferase